MSDSTQDVNQRIQSGEYYRDAMRWYSTMYHSPIAERAMLIIVSGMAVVIILMALIGVFLLLPVTETKTMVVRVPDAMDKVARVERLSENLSDDRSARGFVCNVLPQLLCHQLRQRWWFHLC